MPEYPDITVYIERLEDFLTGELLAELKVGNPFVLRTVDPSTAAIQGKSIEGFRRIGKQIVFIFPDELFVVVHLMIAGRLRWRDGRAKLPGKRGLAAFYFRKGSLLLTEEGSQKRASLHIIRGSDNLAAFDRGGLDVLEISAIRFRERLLSENHTLKRALTDQKLFSGIGNAYSDEILHKARLSPVRLTSRLTDEEINGLFRAVRETLDYWAKKIRSETKDGFPEKVTAFREGMAVHGRFRQPCPDCGTPVQRIRYAENETNYCPGCQTGGQLLADRALSRLLKKDWPRDPSQL